MIESHNTSRHPLSYTRYYFEKSKSGAPAIERMSSKTAGLATSLIPPSFVVASQSMKSSIDGKHVNETFVPNVECYSFLLVDDNIINLMILSRVLKKMYPNANVDTTQNSEEVIEMVKNKRYHAIFLDIEMPAMSGAEIAIIIRSEDTLNHLPLVAVTSKCQTHDLKYYKEIGIDFTFPKPLNINYHYLMNNIDDVMKSRIHI